MVDASSVASSVLVPLSICGPMELQCLPGLRDCLKFRDCYCCFAVSDFIRGVPQTLNPTLLPKP